jgi:hypothetical protein
VIELKYFSFPSLPLNKLPSNHIKLNLIPFVSHAAPLQALLVIERFLLEPLRYLFVVHGLCQFAR